MYKSEMTEESPLVMQEDPLGDSMRENDAMNDVFIGKGERKISIKDIREKIEELSKKVDLSDITKPDCENTTIPTKGICVAYIVFVLVSLIGLIGIFIWKYLKGWIKNKDNHGKKEDSTEKA